MRELKGIKVWTDDYESVAKQVDDVEVLYEFHREGDVPEDEMQREFKAAEQSVERLEFKRMLSDEEDQLSAVIDINPGAGGTESQDWAEMLMRMYIMWAEKPRLRGEASSATSPAKARASSRRRSKSTATLLTATSKAKSACTASCACRPSTAAADGILRSPRCLLTR